MFAPRHELAPTARFAGRAKDYARFRPSYPEAAIDYAIAGLPLDRGLLAADIGAGTGISSRLFADRGIRVIAIEPNAEMRESAEPHPDVSFRAGSGETTGLESASVDLVVCAQAFHWFRGQEALVEFRRIVKPGGRFVFLVNERGAGDPATRAYNTAKRTAVERELSEGMRAAIDQALQSAGIEASARPFPFAQALTRDGLVGRARSASYVPKEGPRYEQLLRDLDDLWRAHHDDAGLVSLGYQTLVWRVDLR